MTQSPFHKAYKEVAETGEVRVVEDGFYDDDTFRQRRWFRVAAVPTTGGDVAVLVQDVTERKRAEEAVRDALASLAEADRRKDEFIAVLSHELRNPLAPIRYALPLLARGASGSGRPASDRGDRSSSDALVPARRRPARRVSNHGRQDRAATRSRRARQRRDGGSRSGVARHRGGQAQPRHLRARGPRLAARRRRPHLAGHHEPAEQQREVHAAGRADTARGDHRRGDASPSASSTTASGLPRRP